MTTLMAIAAGAIFFKQGIYLAMTAAVLVGFAQYYSKSVMMMLYNNARDEGMNKINAAKDISDRATLINFTLTVLVWTLFCYSVYIEFFR